MEESFVVLGPASTMRQPQGHKSQPGPSTSQQAHESGGAGPAVGLDAKLQALSRLFEMASLETQIDHPLCLDCEAQLKDAIEAQIQEAERELAAYSDAAALLEAEASTSFTPLSEDEFQAEMQKLKDEEERERQRAAVLAQDLEEVRREMRACEANSRELDELEERYWHDYNEYQLQLRSHVDERDGLLNKIDLASQRLQFLRGTNVYNDVFKIWHDGPFGTISGFRLGRTSEVQVEWDEINAAWGQAVLLLHAMSQNCGFAFSTFKLLPMGSHPRITDKHTTYDLFGPVNKLWSGRYDKAQVGFLTCLKELGQAAYAEDVAAGKTDPFKFPFPLDGDKVNNCTIKLALNSDAKWTKALKFMLADLKVALQWMIKSRMNNAAAPPQLQGLGHEGPGM